MNEDKGLSCRLRAGDAEHVAATRCNHEAASDSGAANHTAARDLNLDHGVSPPSVEATARVSVRIGERGVLMDFLCYPLDIPAKRRT